MYFDGSGTFGSGTFTWYPDWETKHLFYVDEHLEVQEIALLFTKGATTTFWQGKTWTIGVDLFPERRLAEREMLKRRGPKYAEGTWVLIHRGLYEGQVTQLGTSRQDPYNGEWYYERTDNEHPMPTLAESRLEPIDAPTLALGDWVLFGKYAEPAPITKRIYSYGEWRYTTVALVGHYPARSFIQVPTPTYSVGMSARCGAGPTRRVDIRQFSRVHHHWQYHLEGEPTYHSHTDSCLTRGEGPAAAVRSILTLTPRFHVGQRVQWKYSWYPEPRHGLVTMVELDEDGDLRYGVTEDGDELTNSDNRHDFYDYKSGGRDEYLEAERPF